LVDLSRSQQLCGGPNNRSKQLGELRSAGLALREKLVFFASNLQTQRRLGQCFIQELQISAGRNFTTAQGNKYPVQRSPQIFGFGQNGCGVRRVFFWFPNKRSGGVLTDERSGVSLCFRFWPFFYLAKYRRAF